jgi:O-6-methylguanine DNA methyltransferase
MSWMPWQKPIKSSTIVSEPFLKKLGAGVTFFYSTHQLSKSLHALTAFHGESLVFLGLSVSNKALEKVLEDAKTRPYWRNVCWVEVPFKDFPVIETIELWGTPFQISVWKTLLKISSGHHKSYGEIAETIGRPKALRAVGTAVGSNPISGYIPCHRVLPKSGDLGNYHWGAEIKEQLLGEEKGI